MAGCVLRFRRAQQWRRADASASRPHRDPRRWRDRAETASTAGWDSLPSRAGCERYRSAAFHRARAGPGVRHAAACCSPRQGRADVRPHQSHRSTFAPFSIRYFATSKCALKSGEINGVTPSGSGRSSFRAFLHQRFHAIQAAFAGRKQHRRHSARRTRLGARFATDQRRHEIGGGLRVHLRAIGRAAARIIGPWLDAAAHISARLPALRFLHVGIRALVEQQLRGRDIGRPRDDHERRLAVRSGGIRDRRPRRAAP